MFRRSTSACKTSLVKDSILRVSIRADLANFVRTPQ